VLILDDYGILKLASTIANPESSKVIKHGIHPVQESGSGELGRLTGIK